MTPPPDPSSPVRTTAEQRKAVAERRRRLAALVKPGEQVSFARRVELAALLGTSPTTIFRDLEALRASGQPTPRVAVRFYSPPPSIAARDAVLLRMLGHLRLVRADWLADLIYPDHPASAVRPHLESLRARGLIWASKQRVAPSASGAGGGRRVAPPPNLPPLYGLTPAGMEHLRQNGQMPEAHHLTRLHTLTPRTRPLPPAQIQRDVQLASWCAAVLAAARRCVLIDTTFAQVLPSLLVRYQHDKRIVDLEADALVLLRFQRAVVRQAGDPLPWFTGPFTQLAQQGSVVAAFALHVDTGWTDTEICSISAQYRRMVHEPLRTPSPIDAERRVLPIPTLITTSPDRLHVVARAWNRAWDTSAPAVAGGEPLRGALASVGMITCQPQAEHPIWGALWGWYWQLNDFRSSSVPGPHHLLGKMFDSIATWESWCRETPAHP